MFQQCLLGFETSRKEFQLMSDELYSDFVNVMLQVSYHVSPKILSL